MSYRWESRVVSQKILQMIATQIRAVGGKSMEVAQNGWNLYLFKESDTPGKISECIAEFNLKVDSRNQPILAQCQLIFMSSVIDWKRLYEQAALAPGLNNRQRSAIIATYEWGMEVVNDSDTGLAQFGFGQDPDTRADLERCARDPQLQKIHKVELKAARYMLKELGKEFAH